MLAIVLLPHIAVPLYFFLGIRKRKSTLDKRFITFTRKGFYSQYEVQTSDFPLVRLLQKSGIPAATTGNRFELICDGEMAYHYMLREINNAKESIDICTYVFKFDTMSATLLDALVKKAKEGVRVRVLLDLVGSLSANFQKKRFAPLLAAGGEVVFFAPLHSNLFKTISIFVIIERYISLTSSVF